MWCGTGWTGQQNVIQHPNVSIEVRESAYDDHYHLIDGLSVRQLRPDLVIGDLAKGRASSDANSHPLYYGGSRDNMLRVIALDRPRRTVPWQYDSSSQPGLVWNDDWVGDPLQIGDYLLEGGRRTVRTAGRPGLQHRSASPILDILPISQSNPSRVQLGGIRRILLPFALSLLQIGWVVGPARQFSAFRDVEGSP
jgi:hypothetical protein